MKYYHIITIANHEAKLLRRSILFQIFTGLAILGIPFLQLINQGGDNLFWYKIALPSSFPFINVYLYNLLQTLVIIFACTEREKQSMTRYTIEVLQCHPVSNYEFCIGKILGIFKEFIKINFYVLIIGALINIWGSNAPFRIELYLFYFFTLTLPTLFFISGFTLWLTRMIRSQVLIILILIIYFLCNYFYFSRIQFGIFDFLSHTLSYQFSDITGYTALPKFLLVRLGYTLLGIGFLYLWNRIWQRPDNKVSGKWNTYMISILFFLPGSIGILYSWHDCQNQENRRELYRETYLHYQPEAKARAIQNDITYRSNGKYMSVTSKLSVQNQNKDTLSRVILYLNPTLHVTKIQENTLKVDYSRENQVIVLHKKLALAERITLDIDYHGKIDDAICYLDFPEEEISNETRIRQNKIFRFGKEYSFLTENYTLLHPECIWYPVCVPPANIAFPYAHETNFTHFTLNVDHKKEGEVLSQGISKTTDKGVVFVNEQALTGISLCIGKYEKKEMQLGNILLELYYFPKHKFMFDSYQITDKQLQIQITQIKNRIQSNFGRYYPFKKIMFIESPTSYTSYERKWKGGSEYIQPEIVFFPERLFTLAYSPLNVAKKVARKTNPSEDQESLNTQVEKNTLRSFEMPLLGGTYSLSPMFYDYMSFISSDKYPGVNTLLNDLIYQQDRKIMLINNEFTEEYIAVTEYLKNRCLQDGFREENLSTKTLREMIRLKAQYLKAYLSTRISLDELKQFCNDMASRLQFSEIKLEQFCEEFTDRNLLDLQSVLNHLYQEKGLPSFVVKDLQAAKIAGEENKYQIHYKVWNTAQTPGIISLGAHDMEGNSLIERNDIIPPKTCNEIYLETMQEPSQLYIQTHLSQNIPSFYYIEYENGIHQNADKKAIGIFHTDSSSFLSRDIIVDNDSDKFYFTDSTEQKRVLLSSKSKQKKYTLVCDPPQWIETITHRSFGNPIRSTYCKLADHGKRNAVWTTDISQEGTYEIFFYHQDITVSFPPVSSTFPGAKLHYAVQYAGAKKEITIEADLEAEGWISLGIFDLPKGKVQVILNDKGGIVEKDNSKQGIEAKRQLIIADAVKWVQVKRTN